MTQVNSVLILPRQRAQVVSPVNSMQFVSFIKFTNYLTNNMTQVIINRRLETAPVCQHLLVGISRHPAQQLLRQICESIRQNIENIKRKWISYFKFGGFNILIPWLNQGANLAFILQLVQALVLHVQQGHFRPPRGLLHVRLAQLGHTVRQQVLALLPLVVLRVNIREAQHQHALHAPLDHIPAPLAHQAARHVSWVLFRLQQGQSLANYVAGVTLAPLRVPAFARAVAQLEHTQPQARAHARAAPRVPSSLKKTNKNK